MKRTELPDIPKVSEKKWNEYVAKIIDRVEDSTNEKTLTGDVLIDLAQKKKEKKLLTR